MTRRRSSRHHKNERVLTSPRLRRPRRKREENGLHFDEKEETSADEKKNLPS
jgi:hypothetical protein